jgi:CRISPR-associated endonuclease/helicase Cas3
MTLDPKRLWAKSKPRGEQERPSMDLLQHLKDVYESARRVLDATQDSQLSALGLDPALFRDRLRRCVLLAAAVHDIGKANNHFQEMLLWSLDRRDKQQGIRHEWVTVLMLKELKGWLLPAAGFSETDFAFVEWAVAGHHPAHNHESPPRSCPPGAGADIRLHTDHSDFAAILQWLREAFELPDKLPSLTVGTCPLVGGNNVFQQLAKWSRDAHKWWDTLKKADDVKLLAAIKNCLIAADVAGSALPKVGTPDWGRITQAFADLPEPGDFQAVVNERTKTFQKRNQEQERFQKDVADSKVPVTYVKAGCGTGKTLAAYMWAAKNHPTRRLFFCYPTTGTATEGFKDYLFEPDEQLGGIGAKLFHSRSRVDHEIILTTGGDSKSADADAVAKADALEMWSTPVVACTVDTVLGIVQNNRKGLFAWPALSQSAFVFDEIHAYDDRLFGALLRFLRDMPGLPCLLMTASLPTPREEALKEVLEKFRGIDLTTITGPEVLETLPRYHKVADDGKHWELIAAEVQLGGKVLWVSNTVNRVMASADAAEAMGLTPLIYHSRFKYEDRVKRHKAVVEAFTPNCTDGVLACTSQVCEMSLDLKGCTLLVTEAAPVPALIQRLGRLNRHAKDGDPTRPFVVLTPENNLPYTPAELEAAKTWLGKLKDAGMSQRDLADAWEQTGENPPDLVPSAWLDGGPFTTVSELREASPGVTVLMEGDLTKLKKASDLGKFTLPMPRPPKAVDWRTRKHMGIPVVADDTITYDDLRGASWRN